MPPKPNQPTALERKSKLFTPGVVEELREIEQTLGGRKGLISMLALAPLNQDLRYALGMLGDPKHDRLSLAEICARGNILPGELLRHIRSAAVLRGQVITSTQIAQAIPGVIADLLRKAAPYEDACTTCLGTGSITPDPTEKVPNPSPGPCDTCKGSGRLLYQPDLERQRVAIELAQLTPKGGGGGVNILQQFGAAGGGPTGGGAGGGTGQSPFEKLALLSDRILYGSGSPIEDPIDAELVADAPDQPDQPPTDPPADPS